MSRTRTQVAATKPCRGYPAQGLPAHDAVPVTEFWTRKGTKDGLDAVCKDCSMKGRKMQAEKRSAKRAEVAAEPVDFTEPGITPDEAMQPTGREAYFSIAEEMSASDFSMDDMEPAIVGLAKRWAKRSHKRFPPKPVESTMTIRGM